MEHGLPTAPVPGTFRAAPVGSQLRSLDEVRRVVSSGEAQVVDARPAGRFTGRDAEPRPGVRSGHIPGSLSLPYAELVDDGGRMLPLDALRARMQGAGVDLARPVVATCGSGTSACAILLTLELLGAPSGSLYDGAWTEWGSRPDLPVETE